MAPRMKQTPVAGTKLYCQALQGHRTSGGSSLGSSKAFNNISN